MKPDFQAPFPAASLVSALVAGLRGSEILKIAADVRSMRESGREILDLTVGDFSPAQFRIPETLRQGIVAALEAGETNYPPSSGVPALRQAVARLYARELGLSVPQEAVVVASGTRPLIYGVYRTLVDPGDTVVYPVPSWNNNHYVHLVGAHGREVVADADTAFLPTAQALAPHLHDARLLALCSPQNPTGTAFSRDALAGICDLVLTENRRRAPAGRPLYVLYDQVYWMLTFGETRHVDPVSLHPEMAPYTIFVDGISKGLAATGLRVGYGVGPPEVMRRLSDLIGHLGAWAPRAEQVATAGFLEDAPAMGLHRTAMTAALRERLDLLHEGMQDLKARGFPVDSIPPMGAIYLTLRIAAHGRRPRFADPLRTNDQIRHFVLDHAGWALVPFASFAYPGETGWFRASVGAVGPEGIRAGLPRLEAALRMFD